MVCPLRQSPAEPKAAKRLWFQVSSGCCLQVQLATVSASEFIEAARDSFLWHLRNAAQNHQKSSMMLTLCCNPAGEGAAAEGAAAGGESAAAGGSGAAAASHDMAEPMDEDALLQQVRLRCLLLTPHVPMLAALVLVCFWATVTWSAAALTQSTTCFLLVMRLSATSGGLS